MTWAKLAGSIEGFEYETEKHSCGNAQAIIRPYNGDKGFRGFIAICMGCGMTTGPKKTNQEVKTAWENEDVHISDMWLRIKAAGEARARDILETIDQEIEQNPNCLIPFTQEMFDEARELTKGIIVDLDAPLDEE